MSESALPPLLTLVGPTAVGKTDFAIRLALELNAEVISADSRYFYRGMDIGTAKPSLSERQGVPHHLIDVAAPDETWSLGQFRLAALQAIDEIHARGRLPLLTGGTGQYIRAVTEGWSPPEIVPNPALRQALEGLAETHSPYWLHDKLNILDPEAAARIDPRNLRRTVRALEVIFSSGRLFSSQSAFSPAPFGILQIGLTRPREVLYRRVDERIESMFQRGFLDEVRGLLAAGYSSSLPSMSAIGYREAAAVLGGQMSLEEAIAQMKRLTRIFVRRQANWFKVSDERIHWLEAENASARETAAWARAQLLLPGGVKQGSPAS